MEQPFIDVWSATIRQVDPTILSNMGPFQLECKLFCETLGLNIVDQHLYYFGPGSTVSYILSESHIGFHSWPEHAFVHFVASICTPCLTHESLTAAIIKHFGTENFTLTSLNDSS